MSIGIAWVLFALANKLLPYTRVNWIPAIVSGLVVALAFAAALVLLHTLRKGSRAAPVRPRTPTPPVECTSRVGLLL